MLRRDALPSIRAVLHFPGLARRKLLLAAAATCGSVAACTTFEVDVGQPIAPLKPSWFADAMDADSDRARPDDRSPAAPGPRAAPEHAEADTVLREVRRLIADLAKRAGLIELRDPSLAATTPGPSHTKYFVQIGSHQVMSGAEGQMEMTRLRLGPALENFELRVRPVQLGSHVTFFRVQIGPLPTQSAAADMCRSLQSQRQECFALAEKTQESPPSQDRAEPPGGWASIKPADLQFAMGRKRGADALSAGDQIAETLPLYTAPGLPGIF